MNLTIIIMIVAGAVLVTIGFVKVHRSSKLDPFLHRVGRALLCTSGFILIWSGAATGVPVVVPVSTNIVARAEDSYVVRLELVQIRECDIKNVIAIQYNSDGSSHLKKVELHSSKADPKIKYVTIDKNSKIDTSLLIVYSCPLVADKVEQIRIPPYNPESYIVESSTIQAKGY